MRRPEGVIFTLGPLGEAGKSAALPQRADTITPPGTPAARSLRIASKRLEGDGA